MEDVADGMVALVLRRSRPGNRQPESLGRVTTAAIQRSGTDEARRGAGHGWNRSPRSQTQIEERFETNVPPAGEATR